MQRTLNEHILQLHHRIQELGEKLTKPAVPESQRAQIESEIRVADLALTCYLKAFEIEQKALR